MDNKYTYAISSDTTCDIPEDILRTLDLPMVDIPFIIDDVEYSNIPSAPTSMPIAGFWDKLREGKMPTTRMANVADHTAIFEPILSGGQDIIHISFTSGMSSTYNCAVTAAEELREKYPDRRISVVDSRAACMGEGLVAMLALKKRESGATYDETLSYIEQARFNCCHWVIVDDLNHLHRGGRVSRSSAIIGTMVGIKPIIYVDQEGRLIPIAKERGRAKANQYILQRMAETVTEPEKQTVFIMHVDAFEQAELIKKEIVMRFAPKEVVIGPIGTTIASHIGIGTIALFFVGSQRKKPGK